MELKNYFGVEELLSEKSAPAIWEACNAKLREGSFSARGLICQSNVKALCTTGRPGRTPWSTTPPWPLTAASR